MLSFISSAPSCGHEICTPSSMYHFGLFSRSFCRSLKLGVQLLYHSTRKEGCTSFKMQPSFFYRFISSACVKARFFIKFRRKSPQAVPAYLPKYRLSSPSNALPWRASSRAISCTVSWIASRLCVYVQPAAAHIH